MSLYELLLDKSIEYGVYGLKHLENSKVYHESMGKMRMCGELIDMLSDETLKKEVTTRVAAIAKGEIK